MIGVAVIGTGLSALNFHIPLIQSLSQSFELRCILDRKSSTNIKDKFPNVQIVTNLEDLLRLDEISLIVLSIPNDQHYSFAKAILLAGKHGNFHHLYLIV